MKNRLFIGVDVATSKVNPQFLCYELSINIFISTFKFPNNPEGNDMVINKIKDIEKQLLL